jgi:hypothetical protein
MRSWSSGSAPRKTCRSWSSSSSTRCWRSWSISPCPISVWATLILSAIGFIGLTVTFNKPQREKTLDRIIWVADAVVVLYAIYLLATQ